MANVAPLLKFGLLVLKSAAEVHDLPFPDLDTVITPTNNFISLFHDGLNPSFLFSIMLDLWIMMPRRYFRKRTRMNCPRKVPSCCNPHHQTLSSIWAVNRFCKLQVQRQPCHQHLLLVVLFSRDHLRHPHSSR